MRMKKLFTILVLICFALIKAEAYEYPITVSGAEVQNYAISYTNGKQIVTGASDFNEEKIYQALYRMLSTPYEENGVGDINNVDAGSSDFVRGLWNLNELPTDEATCWWNDPGLPELNSDSWDYHNPLSKALFARLHLGIFKANLYLENAPISLAQRRAEVRFLRALFYFHALDLFGNVPLMTSTQTHLFNNAYDYIRAAGLQTSTMSEEEITALEESFKNNTIERPKQVGCPALFDFIVNELKACEADLPASGTEIYTRPSKAAAWLLLARLYLNAEVYTGIAQWAEAQTYAKKVIDSNAYTLCTNYRYLFMGDNNTNGAQQEMIFPVYAGSEMTPSWGCTTYLIAACYDYNMPSNGMTETWAGIRARKTLVGKFDQQNDDRALFYSQGHTLEISDLNAGFSQGYAVVKFTNLCSDGTSPSMQFAETDYPLMRLAEAYLTFAEADAHLHGGTCTTNGAGMLNLLRTRAHVSTLPTVTLGDIADEWAREFMFEGRRRSDLIRLGLFTGDKYLWDWKGGQQAGKSVDGYLARYPLPDIMMELSEDYVQNTGYMDINKVTIDKTFTLNTPDFASQTVALREVEKLDFTWQRPNVTGIDASEISYRLQVSLSNSFTEEYNNYYSYYSTSWTGEGEINSEYLDELLLFAWNNVKRYSDFTVKPTDIYIRCVATIGNKESVSNVLKMTVLPYINNVNAVNYYLVGSGIGNGQQVLSSDGIGTSMLPMDIDYASYQPDKWNSGKYTLTTCLVKDSPFWLRQMTPSYYFYTLDGTVGNAEKHDGYDSLLPETSQMFTVSETGTYEITLNTNPEWRQGENGEWVHDPYLTLTKKDDMANGIRSVNIAGDATATMQQSAAGHIWQGTVTMEQEGRLHFVVDGQPYGDTGFSFGYAKSGNDQLTVPAGNYVVTYNTTTGFYAFYDTDDTRFIWGNPYRLMYQRTFNGPFEKYYYIGSLNNWNLGDDSYPLTTDEGIIYRITIPAPQSNGDGWFKIASEEAMTNGDWDGYFMMPSTDGSAELEGSFYSYYGSYGGAWNLPVPTDGSTHYELEFNLGSNRYKFTPINFSSIREVPQNDNAVPTIYTLGGMRVNGNARQLPKGIYIIGGQKVVVK